MLLIDSDNYQRGNEAMASVLLLYYHLATEGRFSHSETVYLDPSKFDGFSFLNVSVSDNYKNDINETLLREGAIIYLLCELNDMISEFEETYLSLALTQSILLAEAKGQFSAIPETQKLCALISAPTEQLTHKDFYDILHSIFIKYVLRTFIRLTQD